jgi:hypothetical protein
MKQYVSPFDAEAVIEKLKRFKSLGTDQILPRRR